MVCDLSPPFFCYILYIYSSVAWPGLKFLGGADNLLSRGVGLSMNLECCRCRGHNAHNVLALALALALTLALA